MKESCKIHRELMGAMKSFLFFFALALFTLMLGIAEASLFDPCAIVECGSTAGGWQGVAYDVTILLNTVAILGTLYYGGKSGFYYITWKMECHREEHD